MRCTMKSTAVRLIGCSNQAPATSSASHSSRRASAGARRAPSTCRRTISEQERQQQATVEEVDREVRRLHRPRVRTGEIEVGGETQRGQRPLQVAGRRSPHRTDPGRGIERRHVQRVVVDDVRVVVELVVARAGRAHRAQSSAGTAQRSMRETASSSGTRRRRCPQARSRYCAGCITSGDAFDFTSSVRTPRRCASSCRQYPSCHSSHWWNTGIVFPGCAGGFQTLSR